MVKQIVAGPSRLTRSSCLARTRRKVAANWYDNKISHRTEYSVERLLAFRDYHRCTSTSRVIVVCALTPLPALLVALAIDCIPLKSPSDGWRDNYTLWIRQLIAIFFESLGIVLQVRAVIMTGTISDIGAVTIALGAATTSVAVTIGVAATWRFPIPFGYVILLNVYVLLLSICMVIVIGPRFLAGSLLLRQQIKAQLFILANQGIVAVCYPIFSAIFNRLPAREQAFFIFVMPLIKFFTKQNIANAAKGSHEYVGPMVVFSVDLFNVYYVAICMQTAKSLVTTLVIIAADSFHVVVALRGIYRRASLLQVKKGQSGRPENYLRDLLDVVHDLFDKSGPQPFAKRPIRLLAPFPLPLSDESSGFMKKLSKTGRFSSRALLVRRSSAIPNRIGHPTEARRSLPMTTVAVQQKQKHQVATVHPAATNERKSLFLLPGDRSKKGGNASSLNLSDAVVRDALQTLFHSEYILLAEYIELMIPMLYSFYLTVLFHQPVAVYYPNTASMTAHELKVVVASILAYAAIEVVSFSTLLGLLWRNFGFSPLYQLAFVLETQAPALQGYLFMWTITILHLTLAHYVIVMAIQVAARPGQSTQEAHEKVKVPQISRVKRKLDRSQIGHRSEYSVEWLLAFHDYCQRPSTTHAVAVCVLTAIPALLIALTIDCIPLRPPSQGWRANYGLWIRRILAMFCKAVGVVFQVRDVIDAAFLVTIMVAALWKFPAPFGYVLLLNVYVLLFATSMILVIGPRVLKGSPTLHKQIKSQLFIIANQGVVAVFYPVFSAIFTRLSGIEQTAFILAMPMIKFFTKQNIANAAENCHEYVGPLVEFSVDVFNVYYVAIWMQTSKSVATTLAIMAADSFHLVVALRFMLHQTQMSQMDKGKFFSGVLERICNVYDDAKDTPPPPSTSVKVDGESEMFKLSDDGVLGGFAHVSGVGRARVQALPQARAGHSAPRLGLPRRGGLRRRHRPREQAAAAAHVRPRGPGGAKSAAAARRAAVRGRGRDAARARAGPVLHGAAGLRAGARELRPHLDAVGARPPHGRGPGALLEALQAGPDAERLHGHQGERLPDSRTLRPRPAGQQHHALGRVLQEPLPAGRTYLARRAQTTPLPGRTLPSQNVRARLGTK
ncbi:hypothetical protein ON010_g526 [Phytophthora cinnamomi]|nr:hypothetical protein ON010_g526 [Phytophthora cinnamomi]